MHLEVIRGPEAANQRFIACSESIYTKKLGKIVTNEFGPERYKITIKEKGNNRYKAANISNIIAIKTF